MDTSGLLVPAGQSSGYSFHPKQWECPIEVCRKSHSSHAALLSHISQAHSYPCTINPQVLPAHRIQLPSPPIFHISTGEEFLELVFPPNQCPQRDALIPNIPQASLQDLATAQPKRLMPPPPLSGKQGDLQQMFDHVHWTWLVSSSRWPLEAHQLVENLVVKYRYKQFPHYISNAGVLKTMFDEFYTRTDFGGPPPSKSNPKLSHIFKTTADRKMEEMERNCQLNRRKDAVQFPNPSITKSTNTRTTSMPLSTPPTTSVISNAHRCNPLKLWDIFDADTQAKLFRQIIRNAKLPQSLVAEWGAFQKEKGEKSVEERLLALEQCPSLTEKETATPEPASEKLLPRTKPNDLKIMIQERLSKSRCKRGRDNGKFEEVSEAEQKRTKFDSV